MKGNTFFIDKITRSIEDALTGLSLDTDVKAVVSSDLEEVLKKNGWKFSWKMEIKYKDRQLYKLVIRDDDVILRPS
jgi:hypothetical protein